MAGAPASAARDVRAGLAVVLCLLIGATQAQAPVENSAAAVGSASTPGEMTTAALPDGPGLGDRYRLGAGDKLKVIVYGEDDLSGDVLVDSAGSVRLPLLGQVQAQGKTVVDFEHDVASQFVSAGYLKKPQVNVEVLAFRPFYIIGEVNKPGEYPYKNGMNVLNAVAVAGGFTYRSSKKKVYIRTTGTPESAERPVSPETEVEPGDIIRIPERFF